jgi:hypothetical protein
VSVSLNMKLGIFNFLLLLRTSQSQSQSVSRKRRRPYSNPSMLDQKISCIASHRIALHAASSKSSLFFKTSSLLRLVQSVSLEDLIRKKIRCTTSVRLLSGTPRLEQCLLDKPGRQWPEIRSKCARHNSS